MSLLCVPLIGLLSLAGIAHLAGPARQSPRAEEVKFDGADLKLSGTMLLPKAPPGRRLPAVLIVGGAESKSRDEARVLSSAHPLYRDLASHLAAQGLAVLRYDPRCSATDACTLPHSLHDYGDDARGGLLYLRARPEIDPNRVFVLGHNEGGIFAASAVAHAEDEKIPVAGLVLISTPGRVYGKLARERARRRLSEEGRPPAEIDAYLARLERLTSEIAAGRFTFENEKIDPQDRLLGWLINRPRLYFHLLSDDPLQIVRQVHAPVLILQGERDIYVGTRDAQYLEEALKRQYHRDLTLRLLPQVDHWLQTSRGETTLKTDAEKARPLDPGALGALAEWFERQLKTGPKS